MRSPRPIAFILLIASVAGCLWYGGNRGDLPEWWKQHGGGIPYVLFWIFLAFAIWPRQKWIVPICVGVVLVTTGLEFLQLWNPEPLASFRQTTFGAALLGTSFVWADIPPYFIGGLVGFFVLKIVYRISGQRQQPSAE